MDKKIKHITVNLTQDQYDMLVFLADHNRRKLADMAFILLADTLQQQVLKAVDIKNSGFHKVEVYK